MNRETAERCLELLRASPQITTLDITGGAPELNAQFRYLVEEASKLDVEIIDRCNLTVLVEPGQEDLPEFLAKHNVCKQHLPHALWFPGQGLRLLLLCSTHP
jgi:MoaA/NifB/PqqE/SkfB family radical SAM enzyme